MNSAKPATYFLTLIGRELWRKWDWILYRCGKITKGLLFVGLVDMVKVGGWIKKLDMILITWQWVVSFCRWQILKRINHCSNQWSHKFHVNSFEPFNFLRNDANLCRNGIISSLAPCQHACRFRWWRLISCFRNRLCYSCKDSQRWQRLHSWLFDDRRCCLLGIFHPALLWSATFVYWQVCSIHWRMSYLSVGHISFSSL